MSDLISRQATIDALDGEIEITGRTNAEAVKGYVRLVKDRLERLPSAQPENQVHLCDSCRHVFPECPSEEDDVIYGNGKGNDNICACNKYEPSAQPERKKGQWMKEDRGHVEYCAVCDQCGFDWIWSDREYFKFCPNCGADMRGE